MAQRQRTRSPAYRARRAARKALKVSTESSHLASAHHSVQQAGSVATVDDGRAGQEPYSTSGPEATALQGTSKFEGYDAEGLAIYSNVDLS
jgi:hypothetical protein